MVICSALRCSLLKVLISLCELQLFVFLANGQLTIFCPNTATYNQKSTYQTNLRRLLSDLSSKNATNNLFLNATVGENAPDVIYGLSLCRGDLSSDTCRECLQKATTEIVEPQRCPKEKIAIIWYDECMLRYSNQSFFGNVDTFIRVTMWNVSSVSEPDRFDQVLADAMDKLINEATRTESIGLLKGFAAGESSLTSIVKLYSLVQCTKDLSSLECNRCLRTILGEWPAGRQGGRVFVPSCNIRYAMYPFYKSISAQALPSPPPSSDSYPPPTDQVPHRDSGGKGGVSDVVITAIVVPIIVSVVLFIVAFCFLRRKAKKQQEDVPSKTSQKLDGVDGNDISAAESLQYDLNFIRVATKNFSADNKIGEGVFGEVFKGTLIGKQIAVRRIPKSSRQGDQEFKNVALLVARLRHKNLVTLLGYCLDEGEKILVYEFFPNKSLDSILFDQEKQQSLDWSIRYKIIGGVARGILYLHKDSRLRIVHRDLKASNVLLDNDMNAKISDFGMAKIVGADESQLNTNRVTGTFGYMSPEYALHGMYSIKSDVYSFGVLVLEIISGKKNDSFHQSGRSEDLLSYAWKLWRYGRPLDLMDPTLGHNFVQIEVIRCIQIGLLCVQEDPEERPTMASVDLMLSSYSVTLPFPHQPAFFFHSRMAMSKHSDSDESSSKTEASITELYT